MPKYKAYIPISFGEVAPLEPSPCTTMMLGDPGRASRSSTVIGRGLSTLPSLKTKQFKLKHVKQEQIQPNCLVEHQCKKSQYSKNSK